jgi:outer membrane protein
VSTSAPGSEARPGRWVFAIAAAIVLIAGLATSSSRSRAADNAATPGLRLAVVDFAIIRRQAAAVQSINNQLETRVVAYQNDIEKEEEELKTAQKELDTKRQHLSADAYTAELRQWEKNVSEAQRRFLRRRQDLEKARADAWQQVNQRVDKIIKDIAGERGLDVIVRRDQTVFVTPRLEITNDVLSRLDKELPSVELLLPGG